MVKKGQTLTLCLVSEMKDLFGVIEVCVSINGKCYTYPLDSEWIVKKVKKLIRLKKFGRAIQLLKQSVIGGFNYYETSQRNEAKYLSKSIPFEKDKEIYLS